MVIPILAFIIIGIQACGGNKARSTTKAYLYNFTYIFNVKLSSYTIDEVYFEPALVRFSYIL